ncbi:AEC family transporter [Halococcus thailandensis]|uniref:Permease n=1 Tax=Halococcus thailandensis JCM 13552 TaxID=1227457 RepID=M0N1K8_9EURY|nr:AEC family transporter [Halococcus thailandensis]EMA51418.1 permease [Halococcus thailandensis JCM 13552]
MSLLSVFATAILPIVTIAAVGFVLGRVREIDVGPLNTVTVYVLVPALVFHSLTTTTVGGATLAKVFVGVVVFILVMVGLAEGVGRVLGESEPIQSAFVLVSAFSNSGNYGIPLSEFAFGETGRATAVLYLVAQSVVIYTVGVYLASRAGGARGLGALTKVFRLPLVYAVVLALVVRALGLVPPADGATMTTIQLVGDASIPLMLILVGIQLASANYGAALSRVGPANVFKLLVAPAVGLAIVSMLDFGNTTVARVFVLECAAPAAITSLILLIELGGEPPAGVSGPEYVSAAVLTTTLLSVPVLTLLITLLKSGLVESLL